MAQKTLWKPAVWTSLVVAFSLVVLALGMRGDYVRAAAYPGPTSSPAQTVSPTASPSASFVPAKFVCTCQCATEDSHRLCPVRRDFGVCYDYNFDIGVNAGDDCSKLDGKACEGWKKGGSKVVPGSLYDCSGPVAKAD